MRTRSAAIRTNPAFHTFVNVLLIASFLTFSLRLQVHYTPLPPRDSAAHSKAYTGETFRGPIRLVSFDSWTGDESNSPPSEEEDAMSPKDLLDRWQPLISEASKRFAVPENWIRAVIRIESGGRTILFGRPITSAAGAMGLMQLMSDTYNEMRTRNGLGDDPYDARDNIMAGTAYLHELYMKYGYPRLFAAYNAGPGRLENHLHSGHPLPAETRAYVRLATDGAVAASLGDAKPVKKRGGKTRVAAVYLPAVPDETQGTNSDARDTIDAGAL
jgi:membrane-bound lytic murein transglycosylase B